MNKSFVIKYLIGGYGSLGRVVEDYRCGKTYEDVLNQFWKRYEHLLDCVKPTILGLYLRESGDTRLAWEKRKIELTKQQMYGH